MPPFGDGDINKPWYEGGQGTATGSALGNFFNEVSGKIQEQNFNAEQAAITRVFNSAEAQKDRDFQMYMANTAYQRGIQDMKAAGLNPAAIGGNAADVPSGAMASASPASSPGGGSGGFLSGIARAVLSAALFKKFSASAMSAGSAASAVAKVGQDLNETRRVFNRAGLLKGTTTISRSIRDVYQ